MKIPQKFGFVVGYVPSEITMAARLKHTLSGRYDQAARAATSLQDCPNDMTVLLAACFETGNNVILDVSDPIPDGTSFTTGKSTHVEFEILDYLVICCSDHASRPALKTTACQ